ncbi:hypothetical protein V866_004054 [Kwoniella sp. B9012]
MISDSDNDPTNRSNASSTTSSNWRYGTPNSTIRPATFTDELLYYLENRLETGFDHFEPPEEDEEEAGDVHDQGPLSKHPTDLALHRAGGKSL